MRETKYENIGIIFFILMCCASFKVSHKVIFNDVLNRAENWVIEQQPNGKVEIGNGRMEIIDAKGCTVWFKQKLEGNIKIQFDVTVIANNGSYDRVSDMNCFWMANDPNHPKDFFKESEKRAGIFPNYNQLKLYYVGYGGYDNTKTRFRRYDGNIDRPLLPENDLADKKFMITANKKMHIEILVKGNHTSYSRDGVVIFDINDPEPYTEGYFGFRTVENHEVIKNFKVIKLK